MNLIKLWLGSLKYERLRWPAVVGYLVMVLGQLLLIISTASPDSGLRGFGWSLMLIGIVAAFVASWPYRHEKFLLKLFSTFIYHKTMEALLDNDKNEELKDNGLWVRAQERELTEQYGSRWIAVVSKKVVAVAESGEGAWEEARKKYPDRTPFVKRLSKEHLDFETDWNKRSN